MPFHRTFYRSLLCTHLSLVVFEFIFTIVLIYFVLHVKQDLFFEMKETDYMDWELIPSKFRIIILVLFLIGTIRTVVMFISLIAVILSTILGCCCCTFCTVEASKKCFCFFCGSFMHRCLSFNCNCPCYRSRPKLRFHIQLIFIMFLGIVRIINVAICMQFFEHVSIRSIMVIIAISFVFLILTSLLEFYHYRVWWNYKPKFSETDIEIVEKPLSPKHVRFLPFPLLGDNRTGKYGDRLCQNVPCHNRKLEHIVMFHRSAFQPQSRWSDLNEVNLSAQTYIGFHTTSTKSALAISRSDFIRSTRPPQMLGYGIYFARSMKGTIGKARFGGVTIAAEIRMGNVKRVTKSQLQTVQNTDSWHPEYDTVYYEHEEPERDEFCIYDEKQILRWIMVVDREFDLKLDEYGMNEEFNDTKCYCI